MFFNDEEKLEVCPCTTYDLTNLGVKKIHFSSNFRSGNWVCFVFTIPLFFELPKKVVIHNEEYSIHKKFIVIPPQKEKAFLEIKIIDQNTYFISQVKGEVLTSPIQT